MAAVLFRPPNVHFILLKHMELKEIKAENDPSIHTSAKKTMKADSFYFLSGVDTYASPLPGPERAQAHPSDDVALMWRFCLTCFYCQLML